MLSINIKNYEKIKSWIETKNGVAVWNSINLSNPGGEWLTPYKNENGEIYTKPNWQCSNKPTIIITSLSDIKVIKPKEIKRFPIAIRKSANGLMLKLTDHSSTKVKKAIKEAGEKSWYEFDYNTQEAIIFIPDNE